MQPNKPVVLVVDDDPVNLDILVQTLEQDYFLIIAKNGKRALDLAFSHHPDLILLDILMPEMDGFEVCQRLKADKGGGRAADDAAQFEPCDDESGG